MSAMSLRNRLLLVFGALVACGVLLIEAVGLFGVPGTRITGSIEQLRNEAMLELNRNADDKRTELQSWVKERREDIGLLTEVGVVAEMAGPLAQRIRDAAAKNGVSPAFWKQYTGQPEYRRLLSFLQTVRNVQPDTLAVVGLRDAETGLIVASSRGDHVLGSSSLLGDPQFEQARTPGQDEIIDLFHSPIDKVTYLRLTRQLFSRDEQGNPEALVGILTFLIQVEAIPLMTLERLSDSLEVILIGHDRRIMTPLRFPLNNGQAAGINEYRLEGEAATLAASGGEGVVVDMDYRGIPVLAAYRHVRISPDIGWGIIVKRDESDALAPIVDEKQRRIWLMLGALVVMFGSVTLVARRIAAPIISLAHSAQQVAAGELSVRSGIQSTDEIGVLAGAFDAMAEKVQHWHETLSEEVTRRTHQLERASQLYRTLSDTNQAIVHSRSREELFEVVCRVAVDFGLFRAAWITQKNGEVARLVAHHADDEQLCWQARSELGGQCDMAGGCQVNDGALIINNLFSDPRIEMCREALRSVGWCSLASFPLQCEGRVVGSFSVASAEFNAFGDAEVALLDEMAGDISFALQNMEHEQQRIAAEQARRLLSYAVDQSPANVVITDAAGLIEYVNSKFSETTGYTLAECVGKNPRFLKSGIMSDESYRGMWEQIGRGETWIGELCNRKRNGDLYWISSSIAPLREADGSIRHYVELAEDITVRKQYEAQLVRQAHYDDLTGLPNRLLAMDRLMGALARAEREGDKVVVMFVDLDNFKQINDTLGHTLGDALLKHVANRLGSCVRETDTICRLGGDEFLLMLPGIKASAEAEKVASKMVSSFREVFMVEGHEVYTTVSVGLTMFPDDGDTPNVLMRNADAAMYRSKAEGRNAYSFFSSEIASHSRRRLDVETRLRRAIDREELYPVYQMIVDLATGRPIGAEVLLRWSNPELNPIFPDEFIAVAEDIGMIAPIGEYVLKKACAEAVGWQSLMGQPMRIAVNVSSRQLRNGDFVDLVERTLASTGLPPTSLEIEITERAVVENIGTANEILNRLRARGIRVSMDDFGTGYSSLSYLHSLPIDTLKIDKSFIRDLVSDQHDANLTESIIAIGHKLKLEVLAEGIEEKEQLDFLIQRGCNMGQGYYFGRPIPADEFSRKLSEFKLARN